MAINEIRAKLKDIYFLTKSKWVIFFILNK
jgi:hypothetical protein